MNLVLVARDTVKLAKQTGKYLLEQQDKLKTENVESKGTHNFVTYVDKEAEKILVEGLEKIVPQAGFIAEEGTKQTKGSVYNWIVDPLDGTTNYIHGLAPYAISIALQENNETIFGLVYVVPSDEMFFAVKNQGAFLNGNPINVSKTPYVNDALIATGFPYYDYGRLDNFMETLTFFMQNSHGLRRLGSAATDLAYVACGRFEAFYEYGLSPWDVAAGALIVEEAGGKVTDFEGKSNFLFGREIVAANADLFDEFQDAINKIMSK